MQISTAMFFCIILPAGTVGKEEAVKKGAIQSPLFPGSFCFCLIYVC